MALLDQVPRGDWSRVEALVLDQIKTLGEKAESLEKAVADTGKQLTVIADRLGEKGVIALQLTALELSFKATTSALQQEFTAKLGAVANDLETLKKRDMRAAFARYDELDRRLGLHTRRIETVERRTMYLKGWVAGGAFVLTALWWVFQNIVKPVLDRTHQ